VDVPPAIGRQTSARAGSGVGPDLVAPGVLRFVAEGRDVALSIASSVLVRAERPGCVAGDVGETPRRVVRRSVVT